VDEAHTFAGSDGALDVLLTAARLSLVAQALALFPTTSHAIALGNAGNQIPLPAPAEGGAAAQRRPLRAEGNRGSTRTITWSA
jgi:hypothetical protein